MLAKRWPLAVGAMLAVAMLVTPFGQSRVKDTPHNIHGTNGVEVSGGEVCRPCHTPHNGDPDIGYLWNHTLTDATYTLHDDADVASVMSSSSRLCLSCHDGTVALDAFGGSAGTVFMDGADDFGTDLTNHHPIGVDYPTNAFRYNQPDENGNITDPEETPDGSSAHLEEGKVQCASCHFAHGSRDSRGMFLRVDNHGSALCMTCHKTPG